MFPAKYLNDLFKHTRKVEDLSEAFRFFNFLFLFLFFFDHHVMLGCYKLLK